MSSQSLSGSLAQISSSHLLHVCPSPVLCLTFLTQISSPCTWQLYLRTASTGFNMAVITHMWLRYLDVTSCSPRHGRSLQRCQRCQRCQNGTFFSTTTSSSYSQGGLRLPPPPGSNPLNLNLNLNHLNQKKGQHFPCKCFKSEPKKHQTP